MRGALPGSTEGELGCFHVNSSGWLYNIYKKEVDCFLSEM